MSLQIKVVTPTKIAFEGEAQSIQVPGWEGQYGVLPRHAAMLTLSRPGILYLHGGTGTSRFVIDRGFVEVSPDAVNVMVNSCEAADQIDVAAAQKELSDLQDQLGTLNSQDPNAISLRKRIELARVRANL
ncbi:MAG: ATP synthase F1 subunit epsilon [Myxococcota bacterium]|nr:ATP synthase F1 subunit epsilon [Myxococcota bacterium]